MASIKQVTSNSGASKQQPAWGNCNFCSDLQFKDPNDFTRHLRIRHCTREGGSFVCRYGNHGVCSSLPVEGVSDEDYEDHVLRHHVYPATNSNRKPMDRNTGKDPKSSLLEKGSSQSSVEGDKEPWTIFSSSQNLPAVLNDPGRGKQKDFFTKLWGDDFVENAYIGKPEHLPEVTAAHFDAYLKKISRRYRRHVKINAVAATPPPSDILQQFPSLRLARASPDKCQFDVNAIPRIFLQSNFSLQNPETYNAVYSSVPRETDSPSSPTSPTGFKPQSSGKLLQEKLTHYLDLVEVQIAHQVAQKSEAFFQAMTSHDALMDQLSRTISLVRLLRDKVKKIDLVLVKDSLTILRLERLRCNHAIVFEKLKLMATVHQTQPMLQLLLSIPDYVAALDLISTTQEVLSQELPGVHSFRHLDSQLREMERLIDKMLSAEFERYATADLNRPLTENTEVLESEKLVSIVFGMLRQKHFNFIDKYREEAFTTMKAVVKQLVIEELAASDSGEGDVRLTGAGDQLQSLSLPQCCHLLNRATSTLLCVINHVKTVHDVMRDAAAASSGKLAQDSSDSSAAESTPETTSCENLPASLRAAASENDPLLLPKERALVCSRLNELLCAVCDHAHERCAQLLSAQSKDSWLDRATATQVCDLAKLIDTFVGKCETICGRPSTALRSAFKVQASKFVAKFHQERKDKLALILDSECWKQAEVPVEFQVLADNLASTGKIILPKRDIESSDQKPSNALMVGKEKYAVVGTVLLLLKMVAEYCQCAEDLTVMAPNLLRLLVELLQLFNSRSCQLVLGAGALHAVGLHTITSTNLALTWRALHLVLVVLGAARRQLLPLIPDPQRHVTHLDHLERDISQHGNEIENKLLTLVNGLLAVQLSAWEAKPPVPSTPFRNVSKHLRKLHEAISDVLPSSQVQLLYRNVHKAFKQRLKEQLIKMNVVNNGGPQHGVVISELTFYLETLRTLKALPTEELMMASMEDIWAR